MEQELEIKLHCPPAAADTVRADMAALQASQTSLLALYFDTEDRLLDTQGVSLRLRKEGSRWVQTLKVPTRSSIRRYEHSVDIESWQGEQPHVDLARHEGSRAARQLLKRLGSRMLPTLILRSTMTVRRQSIIVQQNGEAVEIAFDEGVVRAADRTRSICEVEFEAKTEQCSLMFTLASQWQARYGLWVDPVAKRRRGELLARHLAFEPASRSVKGLPSGMRSGKTLFCAALGTSLEQVMANASELAAGSANPAHVHQLRVGLRRMRVAIWSMKATAPDFKANQVEPLVAAFRALGALRNLDAIKASVVPKLQAAGAPVAALGQAQCESLSAEQIVRSVSFQSTLLALLAYVHQSGVGRRHVKRIWRADLGRTERQLNRLHKRVTRQAETFEHLRPVDQHDIRKRLKKLRYLADFVNSMYPRSTVSQYMKQLRKAQQALGQLNDEAEALLLFEKRTAQDARAWFAVGWLAARRQTCARDCSVALRGLGDTTRFWK